jgi:predicted transcriptional regulator
MSHTVSIRLDDEVLTKLDALTKASDRSRAWLLAHAVQQYVEHESWQIEAIQATLEKMRQGNAAFAADDDVKQWLESWGTEAELKAPICR